MLPEAEIDLPSSSGDTVFSLNFDQFLITVSDPTERQPRGLGLFGRFSVSDGDVNVVQRHYSIGVSGVGLFPSRPEDSFGVGYFYNDLSSEIPKSIQPRDPAGVEAYYNLQATPWLQVSPNLQIISNPGGQDETTAIVVGLRTKVEW